MLNKIQNIFAVIIVLSVCRSTQQQDIGESCRLQSNNQAGTCMLLKDCPEALAGLRNGKFPQTCGFQGTVPIVCCTGKEKPPIIQRRIGDTSLEKCREYGLAVYELQYPPTFDIDVQAINVSTCAVVVTPLVIGGTDANPREFPHMALLGYGDASNKLWKCGGSLISNQFVLTAGHCLNSRDFGAVRWIRLGDLNIKRTDDTAKPEEFSVLQSIPHPEYKPPSQYNDIALIKLDRVVKFNGFQRPACLHTLPYTNTTRYIATGWGLTQFGGQQGSDALLKVVLDSFSNEQCNASYESNISERRLKYGILPGKQMCAGGTDTEKDTCQGDSGGPLQIFNKEVKCMYNIVGVTSFGKTCGVAGIPGVYTRVSEYLDWIEKTVWT